MQFCRAVALTLLLATMAAPRAPAQQQGGLPFEFSSVFNGNFQLRTDSAARLTTGGEPTNRFEIARAYLTFRFPAGDRANVRITTDIFQQSNPANSAYYPGWAVRLKYGYVHYDATRNMAGMKDLALWTRFGMLQTVIIEQIESFWPRWIGNTAIEQAGFFSSADLGVSANLGVPGRRGELYLVVTNGVGYQNPENDRFKDVAARFTWTPFANDSGYFRGLAVSPWYYKGWNASAYTQAPTPVSEGLQKDRRGVFVGVRDRRLTFGAEYDQRLEEIETTAPPAPRGALNERTSDLVSGFIIARPVELFQPGERSRLGLVARYDRFRLATDADPYTEFLVAGAFWELTPRLSIGADYQGTTPRNTPNAAPVRTWFLRWTATF